MLAYVGTPRASGNAAEKARTVDHGFYGSTSSGYDAEGRALPHPYPFSLSFSLPFLLFGMLAAPHLCPWLGDPEGSFLA